mmetsp:Transcript_127147/g.368120  ORF Transcript_127147/g.368120 Transcript_127147/m.368120 type:complete len:229 (-) Transcript_127147:746-1432(-)
MFRSLSGTCLKNGPPLSRPNATVRSYMRRPPSAQRIASRWPEPGLAFAGETRPQAFTSPRSLSLKSEIARTEASITTRNQVRSTHGHDRRRKRGRLKSSGPARSVHAQSMEPRIPRGSKLRLSGLLAQAHDDQQTLVDQHLRHVSVRRRNGTKAHAPAPTRRARLHAHVEKPHGKMITHGMHIHTELRRRQVPLARPQPGQTTKLAAQSIASDDAVPCASPGVRARAG